MIDRVCGTTQAIRAWAPGSLPFPAQLCALNGGQADSRQLPFVPSPATVRFRTLGVAAPDPRCWVRRISIRTCPGAVSAPLATAATLRRELSGTPKAGDDRRDRRKSLVRPRGHRLDPATGPAHLLTRGSASGSAPEKCAAPGAGDIFLTGHRGTPHVCGRPGAWGRRARLTARISRGCYCAQMRAGVERTQVRSPWRHRVETKSRSPRRGEGRPEVPRYASKKEMTG